MKQLFSRPRHNPEVDKMAYEAWASEGSLKRAADKLAGKGIISSHGKPFAAPGLRRAAYRYMVDNYAEAKQKLIEDYKDHGYIVEDIFIERFLIKAAIEVLETPEKVKFWLIKCDLMEKHQDFINSMITVNP